MKSIYSQSYRMLLSRITQARKEAGITQAELAEQLGRPQSVVSKIASGDGRIHVAEFLRVAHLIGFDPCALIQDLRLTQAQKTKKIPKKRKV